MDTLWFYGSAIGFGLFIAFALLQLFRIAGCLMRIAAVLESLVSAAGNLKVEKP